jgi:hypothetical protein
MVIPPTNHLPTDTHQYLLTSVTSITVGGPDIPTADAGCLPAPPIMSDARLLAEAPTRLSLVPSRAHVASEIVAELDERLTRAPRPALVHDVLRAGGMKRRMLRRGLWLTPWFYIGTRWLFVVGHGHNVLLLEPVVQGDDRDEQVNRLLAFLRERAPTRPYVVD